MLILNNICINFTKGDITMENIMNFEDYHKKYSNIENDDWIIIYEKNEFTENYVLNDMCTFGVLIENIDSSIAKCLKDSDWGFNTENFGKSYFGKNYYGGIGKEEIFFETGERQNIFEYLIAIRNFNNEYPSLIEINPKIIWYKNLVKSNNCYIDYRSDEEIIRITDQKIEIRKDYLKDYLSANNQCCVINFDHRRWYKTDSKPKDDYKSFNGDFFKLAISNKIISDNEFAYKGLNQNSSIYGKAIIKPFLKPKHEEYLNYSLDK